MSRARAQRKRFTQSGDPRRADAWCAVGVCSFLILAVFLVFGRTLSQGFLNYDDNVFVHGEPHVSGGLTWSGIVWAFTYGPMGEWYPLSMLSHMLDCQLYGLNPTGHHLTNVLLHAASAVTLFLVLWRMTGALWPSALVAALFALHPLRVESVAWVAERRDVLSGLFFMLTLGAYGEYARHPGSLWRYLAVVGLFTLGLMSKSILVTIPPLLLLLDYWPLGRLRLTPSAGIAWRVVMEKLPLLALSLLAAALSAATHSLRANPFTLFERLANAAVSCVAYLGQLFLPVGLSPFYPYPEAGFPAWQVAAAVALLAATSLAAVIGRRAYPYFFVGWFWYLGLLVPVLGLTSTGPQARADRYTYLSQIGLYIALVWGATQLSTAWPARRRAIVIGWALILSALMVCTWRQTSLWQNSRTLWLHALKCDPNDAEAHYLLGLAEEKDEKASAAQFRQAVEIGPRQQRIYSRTRSNAFDRLGDIAARSGRFSDAIADYQQAVEANPGNLEAHLELGGVLAKNGNFDEAILHFRRGLELAPNSEIVNCNMAVVFAEHGDIDEAIARFRNALEINPNFALVHLNLAGLLAKRNDVDEAMVHYRRAIELDPKTTKPYFQLAQLLRQQGKTDEAARFESQGLKIGRPEAQTQNSQGIELARQGKVNQAIARFRSAIAAAPDYAEAHCYLADALASQGNRGEAIAHYRQALTIDPNFAPAKRGLERLSNR